MAGCLLVPHAELNECDKNLIEWMAVLWFLEKFMEFSKIGIVSAEVHCMLLHFHLQQLVLNYKNLKLKHATVSIEKMRFC